MSRNVGNYHSTLSKIPKDLRSHLHRSGNLELRKSRELSKCDMERAFPLSLMCTLCDNLYDFLNAMCSERSVCDFLLPYLPNYTASHPTKICCHENWHSWMRLNDSLSSGEVSGRQCQ
jgi:hypothetical protein